VIVAVATFESVKLTEAVPVSVVLVVPSALSALAVTVYVPLPEIKLPARLNCAAPSRSVYTEAIPYVVLPTSA